MGGLKLTYSRISEVSSGYSRDGKEIRVCISSCHILSPTCARCEWNYSRPSIWTTVHFKPQTISSAVHKLFLPCSEISFSSYLDLLESLSFGLDYVECCRFRSYYFGCWLP